MSWTKATVLDVRAYANSILEIIEEAKQKARQNLICANQHQRKWLFWKKKLPYEEAKRLIENTPEYLNPRCYNQSIENMCNKLLRLCILSTDDYVFISGKDARLLPQDWKKQT